MAEQLTLTGEEGADGTFWYSSGTIGLMSYQKGVIELWRLSENFQDPDTRSTFCYAFKTQTCPTAESDFFCHNGIEKENLVPNPELEIGCAASSCNQIDAATPSGEPTTVQETTRIDTIETATQKTAEWAEDGQIPTDGPVLVSATLSFKESQEKFLK